MKISALHFPALLIASLVASVAEPVCGQKRPTYVIEGPDDFPRFLKPGTVVKFPFEQLNWLKYAPAVTSQGRVQEYAQTTLPGLLPTPPVEPVKKDSSANKGKEALAQLILPAPLPDRLKNLNEHVTAHQELADKLEGLYTADYWLTLAEDRKECAALVQKLFGTQTTSAWQFSTASQDYKEQAANLLAAIDKELTSATAPKKASKKQEKTAAKDINSRSARLPLTKAQLEDLKLDVIKLQARIETQLSADRQKRLATLGRMLVVLQAPAPTRPPSRVVLPDDKDAADLTVDYKLRADYSPAATGPGTTLPKDEFTILLLPRFRITASVGLYASGLVDHSFVFVNDSVATGRSKAVAPDTATRRLYGARKRIERSNEGEWYSLVGAAAFGHFEYRLHPYWALGLTLGVGVQDSGPRLLLGPSVLIGNTQRLILSGGLSSGRVVRLATGYGEGHDAAIKDPGTSQVPTRTITATSWFLALSYNLSSTSK